MAGAPRNHPVTLPNSVVPAVSATHWPGYQFAPGTRHIPILPPSDSLISPPLETIRSQTVTDSIVRILNCSHTYVDICAGQCVV